MINLLKKSYFGLFFFILSTYSAYAQTADLSGYVKDARTGEPLIGVAVTLEGTNQGGVTDINGLYTIKNAEPKTYNVTASYIGYQQETVYNVILRSAGNPDPNFNLKETATELSDVVVMASPFQVQEETQ